MAQNPYNQGYSNYNNGPSYYDPDNDNRANYGSQNFYGFQQPGNPQIGYAQPQGQYQPHDSQPHRGSMINGFTEPQPPLSQGPNYALDGSPENPNIVQSTPRYYNQPGPPGGYVPNSNISGSQNNSHYRELDPSYQKRDAGFFAKGVVFLTLWAEPAGQVTKIRGGITASSYDGEFIHSQIRRFVVVAEGGKHAICVPITTYGEQGTKKVGIDRNAHAIIYTSPEPPKLLPGESRLSKRPIKVRPVDKSLTHTSRVNFGKIYTVEHNTKVALVGYVDTSSLPFLQAYSSATLA